ncbi:unnamed protein product, partial [Chrysoparadoxa australica]
VLGVAQRVLGNSTEAVGADTPLMEAGFDSVRMIELLGILEQKVGCYGIEVPSTILFDYPTLRALAGYVESYLGVQAGPSKSIVVRSSAMESNGFAVVSMACRFPGGVMTPAAFWDQLVSGVDAITEVPFKRWDVDAFYDPDRAAPQKAYTRHGGFIEDADLFDNAFFGISGKEAHLMDPQQRLMLEVGYEALHGAGYTKETLPGTGMGVFVGSSTSYFARYQHDALSAFTSTGTSDSMIANRVSFVLDLSGPSETIDTACSSSLVAVHHACRSLLNGECTAAVAGGVSLLATGFEMVSRSKAQMLAPDGRCKVFDESANGYVPSEGCGAVLLKTLDQATADGDKILAVIKGTAVGHNGRSASLTAPSGTSQQMVIRSALDMAGVEAREVNYVETHGTGTALGDPIEVSALKATYGLGREEDNTLVLGAVKSCIGHLEGAAGIAGLIKTALVLQHQEAPPNLHLNKLNTKVNLSGFSVEFPAPGGTTQLPGAGNLAGVSSFGFGGTNAHVVMEAYPAGVGGHVRDATSPAPKVAFLFSGVGCQYSGMGKELYASEPVFRKTLDECADLLQPWLSCSLQDLLFGTVAAELTDAEHSTPALFALGYALAELWKSKGVVPDAVMGHGLGEVVAACVAGVIPLADALQFTAQGAAAVAAVPAGDSCMHTLGASERDASQAIAQLKLNKSVSIAAVNGPNEVVLAGRSSDVMAVIAAQRSARSHSMSVSHAYHSCMIEAALPALTKAAEAISLGKPRLPLVSCAAGQVASVDDVCSPAHWGQLFVRPVQFSAGMEALKELGCIRFIEIGPTPTLSKIGRTVYKNCMFITSMSEGSSSGSHFSAAVEQLSSSVKLGTSLYINRRIFGWSEPAHPLLQHQVKEDFEGSLRAAAFDCRFGPRIQRLLQGYTVSGVHIFPAAGLLEAAAGAYKAVLKTSEMALRNVKFTRFVELGNSSGLPPSFVHSGGLQTSLFAEGGRFEVRAGANMETLVAQGSCVSHTSGFVATVPLEAIRERCSTSISAGEFLEGLTAAGLTLGASFRRFLSIVTGDGEALATIAAHEPTVSEDWERIGFLLHPAVLDCALQTVHLLLPAMSDPLVPASIGEVIIKGRISAPEVAVHAKLVSSSARGCYAHISVIDPASGELLVQMTDCLLVPIGAELPSAVGSRHPVMGVNWQEVEEPQLVEPVDGPWLVLGGSGSQGSIEAGPEVEVCVQALEVTDYAELMSSRPWSKVVMLCAEGNGQQLTDLQSFLGAVTALAAAIAPRPALYFITRGAFPVEGSDEQSPSGHGWVPGFLRTCRLEYPGLSLFQLDVDNSASLADALQRGRPSEPEVAIRHGKWHAPRLERQAVDLDDPVPMNLVKDGTYVISGGLGGLGLLLARHMAKEGAGCLLLLSRSGKPKAEVQDVWEELQQLPCDVKTAACDVSDAAQVQDLAAVLATVPPVRGVVHAAGVTDDALIVNQTVERFVRVFGPKVGGGWNLHSLAESQAWLLDFFVVYSSISGVLGNPGQSNYAAANTALDGLVRYRKSKGLPASSIQWGPWADVGMAANLSVEGSGMGLVTAEFGCSVVGPLIGSSVVEALVADVDWPSFLQQMPYVPAMLEGLVVHSAPRGGAPSRILLEVRGLSEEQRLQHVTGIVMQAAQDVVADADLSIDLPLIDSGMDSLSLVEFRTGLMQRLQLAAADLPVTAFFDHPSVRKLSSYLDQHLFRTVTGQQLVPERQVIRSSGPVAVIGMACRFPGRAATPKAFWDMLASGTDAITEVPHKRWDVDAFYDSDPDAGHRGYSRCGGFIDDAELFDNTFFGISAAEAAATDPLQRLMLEVGYNALFQAGYNKQSLAGSGTGVFVGAGTSDFSSQATQVSAYSGTGNSASLISNRVSYVLDLKGPSQTIDTACSSSQVATHNAVRSIQLGECSVALVGGVALLTSPLSFIVRCKAQMLAPDGHCKVFDESADGYVPGEGCGAVILKSLDQATADGDKILAVIKGSAVGHNGRSASLTAPSGTSQQ